MAIPVMVLLSILQTAASKAMVILLLIMKAIIQVVALVLEV
jgi:hypothetical protein